MQPHALALDGRWRDRRVRRVCARGVWALAAVALLASCGEAERGAQAIDAITIVIPYRPGGGFDRTVRLFAPFFERHLGGDIAVIPENAAGAGGRLGATKVYRARADGSMLGIFNLPGFVLPEVLGERIDYDLRRLSWIGRLESEDYALLVAGDSPLRSLADLRARDTVTFLSTGYGSTILAASQIVADQLWGDRVEPVFLTGYTGTAESLVGLLRGDGEVAIAPIVSSQQYLDAGELRALAVTGAGGLLPGVPTFAELGFTVLAPLNVQRSIAGPPDMDPDVLARFRDAFTAAVADPEFVRLAEAAGMTLDPAPGPQVVAEVEASFGYYERFKSDLGNPNAAAR